MKFIQKPQNDFQEFISCYYENCRDAFPKIRAMTGKWNYEDLIPGMSDFDTRFLLDDSMTTKDWCEMSIAVGEVHLRMCNEQKRWARILEHLPGINLTLDEYQDERMYYPESKQWTIYRSENSAHREPLAKVYQRPWDIKDEYFNLKKFLTFFGRYDRQIDPPINMGVFENKYPLHSRIMHYFCPPVQSAVSLILKRNVRGKYEGFRMAGEIFPEFKIFNKVIDIADAHYEYEELYREPALTEFEDELYNALVFIGKFAGKYCEIIQKENREDILKWKTDINNFRISPEMRIFDNIKWTRLFKGRLHFYVNAPDFFDTTNLFRIELKRIGNNFYRAPFMLFGKEYLKKEFKNADEVVNAMKGNLLTEQEANALIKFGRLAPGEWESGKGKEIAGNIMEIYEDFFFGVSKMFDTVRRG